MIFFDLETEILFGKYAGKKLQETVLIEPNYINIAVIEYPDFFVSDVVIRELTEKQPNLKITPETLKYLKTKHKNWLHSLDITEEDEESEDPYGYFNEEEWKKEFNLPADESEEEEILKLEAESLEAEVSGKLSFYETGSNSSPKKEHLLEHEEDALNSFPFERLDEWDMDENDFSKN